MRDLAPRRTLSADILSIIAYILALAFSSGLAFADAGVFTGNGQNLRQITSKSIRLKTIDVTMVLGRGPFLFDGTVPGMDEVRYDCKFVLQNQTNSTEEVQVGFPVDSELARDRTAKDTRESMQDWILNYGFIALDEKTTYPVEFVRRKPGNGANEFGTLFVWKMIFAPNETRTLRVSYHMPISMGLVSTEKDERDAKPAPSEALSQEFVTLAQMELTGYITSTGSSWSGNVETAVFTVYLHEFERYLDQRGISEQDLASMKSEDAERFQASFPVRRPWWFREVSLSGWKAVRGGLQWRYENYKPQDSIQVAYYMTQLPKTGSDVHGFVERFLKGLGKNESATVQLTSLRQFILATFGKEPDDVKVRAFVSEQKWYAPTKEFSIAQLSSDQREVLEALDREIAARASR
jgi:hypothetical protein